MRVTLRAWRQKGARDPGGFVEYPLDGVSPHMSFLEMLDVLNESLLRKGEEPVAFDHDCREGICGTCGIVIDGRPHGPWEGTTTCQLHMRGYKDGDVITIEPYRARAFPVIKDLVVDRGALDRIVQSGGYVSVGTGSAPEANAIPVPKPAAEDAMTAASCIGCGACVAACPNAAAMLFTGAKVSHLGLLPQGKPERFERVVGMVEAMDAQGFGHCTNARECAAACPKRVPLEVIARMNRDYIGAFLRGAPREAAASGGG